MYPTAPSTHRGSDDTHTHTHESWLTVPDMKFQQGRMREDGTQRSKAEQSFGLWTWGASVFACRSATLAHPDPKEAFLLLTTLNESFYFSHISRDKSQRFGFFSLTVIESF